MNRADIVFGSKVPDGVEKNSIDIGKLKTLGDEQAKLLADALKAGGSGSGTTSETPKPSKSPASGSGGKKGKKT